MNAEDLQHAASVIEAGGVVAYPTESCFGLGCDPRCLDAVSRILNMKHRSWRKGLILIASSHNQLARFLDVDQSLLDKADTHWPGPVTFLLPTKSSTNRLLKGEHSMIAARVTAHKGARALCRLTHRALVSTSANPQGLPPARSAEQVHRFFGSGVDYVLDGPLGSSSKPTEIRNILNDQIIRAA